MRRKKALKRKGTKNRLLAFFFGLILCINLQEAPVKVTFFQANAYCNYIGGELPSMAELQKASGMGLFKISSIQEWVADVNPDTNMQGYIDWNASTLLYGSSDKQLAFRCVVHLPDRDVWI